MAGRNLELLEAVLRAFNEGRLNDVRRMCAADVRYTIRGHGPLAGVYEGPEEFTRALGRVKELTAGTITIESQVMLEGEDAVMMHARVEGSRSDGRTYRNFQAYLYRFRDGLLVEGQTIPVDQAAFDEFTS